MQDICNKIDNVKGDTIYCTKCGDDKKDVVFSCTKHLTMETFAVEIHNNNVVVIETETRNYCLSCVKKTETRQNCLSSVKKCLQQNYQMLHYEIFKTS